MKTHLPVALRKALLAALVAVSFSTYNQAFAYQVIIDSNGMNVTFDDENGDGGDTVNSSDINVNVEGPIASDNNQIISTGSAAVNALQGISGDGNSISTTSGNIKTGDISGANTSIVSESGNAEVGNITETATGTTIETNTGDLTTGDIAASDITVTMKGTGKLTTGVITGANVQMNAESATLSNLSSMSGTTLGVAGIDAPDTNATLNGSSITSTGNVKIGEPEDDSTVPEADTLTLTNGSSIAAAGDTATMTIDQNVSLSGASSLSTKGGNLTITENTTLSGGSSLSSTGGNVTVAGQVQGNSSSISTTGDGAVSLGSLADGSGQLTVSSENGDVAVGVIKGASDRVSITTGGELKLGTSADAALTNAQISADAGITIGDTPGAGVMVDIRGRQGDAGSTLIETEGNLVVNQSVSIHPGENESSTAGDVTITAGGTMSFRGASTKIAGGDGNAAKASVTAGGSIEFTNETGTEVAQNAKVESLSGNVTMTSGNSATNLIAGEVVSAGRVGMTAGSNVIWGTDAAPAKVSAKSGITIEGKGASNGNGISTAIVTTESGGIFMESEKFNTVFASEVSADKGDIELNGGYVSVSSSTIEAEDGAISLTGAETAVAAGVITASGSVTIAGTETDGNGTGIQDSVVTGDSISVGSVYSKTTIGTLDDADDKLTTLTATGAEKNVEVVGSSVGISGDSAITSRGGDVRIIGSTSTTMLTDVSVEGKTIEISGKTDTELQDTIVDGSEKVTVSGANTSITRSGVSAYGPVTITGTSTNTISGNARVVANTGSVAINGGTTAANTIEGTDTLVDAATNVDIDGAGNTIRDGAAVVAGTIVSMTAVKSNTVTGAATVDAGDDMELLADIDNIVHAAVRLTASGDVTMIAGDDNYITDAGTQVYAGGAVALDGMNNTITKAAVVIGLTRVAAEADENNFITEGAKVSALNDEASVTLAAGEANQIAGSATKVYAGKEVLMSAGTTNLIDAATVTAMNGAVTMGNAAGSTDAVVNSIRAAAKVTAGTDVSMTGDKNAILAGSGVTAIAGSVTMTGASYNAVSESTVKAGADVRLDAGKANLIDGASTVSAASEVSLAADTSNSITGDSEVKAGADVKLEAAENNVINGASDVTAMGSVDIDAGKSNLVAEASTVTAAQGVSMTGDINNILTGSSVTATQDVTMTGSTQNAISGSTVKAGVDVTLTGDKTTGDKTTVDNVITDSTVTAGNDVALTGENNTITAASTVNAGNDAILDAGNNNIISAASRLTAAGSVDMDAVVNTVISDSGTQVYAGETVNINGKNNTVTKEAKVIGMQGVDIAADVDNTINASAQVLAMNDDASVAIIAGEDNLVAGAATKVYAGKDVSITGEGANTVYAASVTAKTGDISMGNAADSTDAVVNTITAAARVTAAGDVSLTGDKNAILAGSAVTAGMDVTMTADTRTAVVNSTVTAGNGSITIGDENGSTETVQNVIASEAGKTTTLTAEQNMTVTGENIITSAEPGSTGLIARNGNIMINGDNYIKYAEIDAQGAEGDVSITTGAGDKNTRIENTSITGETVTIAGDISDDRSAANLAVVTGAETYIGSRGEDDGAGITLNNVSVIDTGKGTDNIKAANGDHIAILNRVDVFNGSLTIQSSDSYDSGAGRIVVDGSNVLNMKADSSLEGRLSGAGSINKSGGDALLLDRDHRDFSGTIYANGAEGGPEGSVADADNAGSWIHVTDAGVGEGARMVLKNTDLVIETWETQIGSLDTTQDAGANKATTGGTLGADASYTSDGNTRADFKTIGSVVEVNKGVSGDVVHAVNLALSDATLLKLDVTVDAGGNASSDIIAATGTVDVAARAGLNSTSTAAAPSTARVYINHTGGAASQAAEGTRTTIMSGTMAGDINADVLYEVEKSANGTYQRTLQDRNVHLENKGDRVDLVFSKNYRSAAKTAPMQKVAEAIRQYSDAFHHSEGWLASSDDRMAKLVDAFDYTRSEAAAQRGLQSLAGMGNVLPQLMLFDASRHHLNQLRKQMEMPVCPRTWKGAPTRKSNAWLAYTGAHDSLNGDANMGDYTRSAHGAMMGVDTALTCKLRAGFSLGYETASGEADPAKVDADSIFVDAYATAYTGHIKHRASIGLALTSFDSRRGVEVEAGYHSFHGTARSDADALTLNFGYEISSDYKLSERSWLTRFASLNLAWHNLDDMKESSLGEIGLVSEYDSEWQAGVAVGLAYNREFAAVKYEAPAVFSAHAAVHFELLADKATATNRFSGADGGWEVESMDREQLYFELGVGVMVPLSPAWTASAGAAVEVGADRSAFSGNVGVRYAF